MVPPGPQAQAENAGAEFFCGRHLSSRGVVENQRVEVAVASVKNIGHDQAVLVGELTDLVQHFADLGTGDGARPYRSNRA